MATAEEIERVSSTLLESFQALSRIEPPMEASPRTMKAFKKLVKTSHQSGGQMFSWAQGMGEALGDEIAAVDDEDAEPLDLHDGQGTWETLTVNDANTRDSDNEEDEDPLIQQVNEILSCVDNFGNPLLVRSLSEFRSLVLEGYRGSIPAMEQAMLMQVVSVYPLISTEELTDAFKGYDFRDQHFASYAFKAFKWQSINDTSSRLLKRETNLMRANEIDGINRFLFGIIRNIEGLVAWEEWEGQPLEFKQAFRLRAARHLNPKVFADIDSSILPPKEKKKRTTSKVRTLFTVKHNKLMLRRGLMHRLYSVFGPCVLFDPFFLEFTSQGHPRGTPKLATKVEMLLREFKGTSYGADGYWNARKLLVRSVGFLGGREMKDYVVDFLDSTIVWMKFAVEEEEDSETEDEGDDENDG
ncbi:hypothetical protein BT96DRAFT_1010260 [Gymnopus androsaceus JB14]|uniref:Uncharacterized protein n=1 Tax=Gymnopus androsaceus JB14 TaxID=1447944 RepID=A0A6A4GAX5_9AGAR|nr:hypothetical protein BT96DRAFT_1010260 [Gymnopus androsaceus JB14]